MNNKASAEFWAGMIVVFLSTIIILASIGFRSYYEVPNPIKIEVDIEDEKPSYEYLKSVTVLIEGRAIIDESFLMSLFSDEFYYEEVGEKTVGWTGTGVVIKEDYEYTYILTNAHVAGKGKQDVSLYIDTGTKKRPAEIVEYHGTLDMAVLKVKGVLENKRPVEGFNVAKPSDPMYLVGHHLGREYIYGEGVFAGYDGLYDIIQIPCLYGNSGSGIMNKDGELVALVFAISKFDYFSVDVAHAIAVDGESIKLYLEKLNLI